MPIDYLLSSYKEGIINEDLTKSLSKTVNDPKSILYRGILTLRAIKAFQEQLNKNDQLYKQYVTSGKMEIDDIERLKIVDDSATKDVKTEETEQTTTNVIPFVPPTKH